MSKLTILALVSVTACTVDAPVDDTGTAESALQAFACNDTGWDFGWDDFSESDPWSTAELDIGSFGLDCPIGTGGGGSSPGEFCGWPTVFTGSDVKSGYETEYYALQFARRDALANAKRACLSSGWVCTPRVDGFDVRDGGCVVIGTYQGEPRYECSATATVTCSYH
jgi:hypothetical protein